MDPSNSRIFECPCCHAKLKIQMATQITGVDEYTLEPKPPKAKPIKTKDEGHTVDEVRVLEMARAGGLLEAFDKTVTVAYETQGTGKPKDIDGYFIQFLKLCKPRTVPQFALSRCVREYGGAIQFFGTQNVLACASDGKIVAFFPLHMLVGVPITSAINKRIKARVDADEDVLEMWIRTKYGYVAGSGAYMEQMRKKSFGEFANPIL